MPGINGIRRCSVDGYLYLTNTDRALIFRLAIDPFDYRPRGQLETLIRNIVCDDFTIDHMGTIYATTHIHNSLMRITPVKDGEYLKEEIGTLADGLAGATSCVFGRTYQDRTSIYITTTGGIVHTHHEQPQVLPELIMTSRRHNSMTPSTGKLLRLDVGFTTGLYEPPKRILVICSSHSIGLYLSEFAEPYNILRKKFQGKEGIEFVIASPKGGSVSRFFAMFSYSDLPFVI
jgi:sugar lactone lactonase YvrE